MLKVCNDWPREAFTDELVSGKYWNDFSVNAKAAAAELWRVPDMLEARRKLEELIESLAVKKVVAVGGGELPALDYLYDELAKRTELYTDKFDIARQAPQADLGISVAEFGVGETGSVCVDTYAFESRVVGMLPPVHVVFLDPAYMVRDVETAFEVIEKVFKSGYMGFITGPSRTADIERVLSLGVHGPSRFIIMAVEQGLERQVH
ncbi:lactate utilization protein [Selenomonas sp. AB3002]|uniref:LutC/YkgG family protein n=1 Tax=Selenomonas sp. AB3002 TaxID=1392502 RepID=UPI0004964806